MKASKAPQKVAKRRISKGDTSLEAQRMRLLQALRKAGSKGVTTIQARHQLNIMMPAARVHSLRHDLGLNVQTIWTEETNPEGFPHRCARYVLLPGRYKEAA